MSVHAPARVRLALTAQQGTLGATGVVRGRTAAADGERRVLAEIAEYAPSVLGGLAAWMSQQHSRQS